MFEMKSVFVKFRYDGNEVC